MGEFSVSVLQDLENNADCHNCSLWAKFEPKKTRLLDRVGYCQMSVLFQDLENNADCVITAIYGPNLNQRRQEFWIELDTVRDRWNGAWCIGGDFNVIRFPEDKLGGCCMSHVMRSFSDWINSHARLDLHLMGSPLLGQTINLLQ